MKNTTKSNVKATQKGIKTAEHTARAATKTTQEAAKATRKAVQASKAAAKTTATTAKAIAKATVATVKAIIAASKALLTALVAGGWVAIVIILLICLIGFVAGSSYGIFFTGEDSGTGLTIQSVAHEINEEYNEKLEEIKDAHSYDVLKMSGTRAVWKEVLAVYAVKTTTDPANAQEVATVDNSKKALIAEIFWEMNEIDYWTELQTETVQVLFDDGLGNMVEVDMEVVTTYLYIQVSHKTADEMADQYGFNTSQRQQLAELLAEKNDSLWSAILYGISSGSGEIVSVALSQVGNIGGEPYWRWYGFDSRVEWCACFVSWCAEQCGYIDGGILPKFANCQNQGIPWFKERGQWQDGSYTPSAGEIIFFDWEGDGIADHVGIVEKVETDRVYTIEGNSDNVCKQRSYVVGSSVICGYGIFEY